MTSDTAALGGAGSRLTRLLIPSTRTAPLAGATAAGTAQVSSPERRWCRLTRALVLLAVLVAGGCWLLHLGLLTAWWVVPLTLAPPFLLPLLALMPLVALLAVRLWRPVPASAVALVAGLLLVSAVPALSRSGLVLTAAPTALTAPPIRVLVWNTEYWDQDEPPGALQDRLAAFDADVYLLQEYLHWSSGPVEINRMTQLRRQFPAMAIERHGELVTISRYPVAAKSVPGNPAPGGTGWPASYEQDKALRTDVRIGSQVLSLYNVHVTVPVDLASAPWTAPFYETVRERHASRTGELDALRRDLARNPNPVLVGGDFNTSPAMADLTASLGAGLRDAAASGSDVYPATWPADRPPLWRLDWALHSKAVQVSTFETPATSGLSDHLPQLLEVHLGELAR